MANRVSNDLPYGHFGEAFYDPDGKVWLFGRNEGTGVLLKPLGEPVVIVQPANSGLSEESKPQKATAAPSRLLDAQIQDLVKAIPDLQPASNLLPPLLRVSDAVQNAAETHDPLQGSLLAFGSIRSPGSHDRVSVAAFASGATGSDLRIVTMRKQRQGWDDTRDAWIEVPTFGGEEVVWHGEGAPIQQICFAQPLERGDALLAVRLPTRTLIFRPSRRKEPLVGHSASRLDANLVLELPISTTGEVSHADVAFNPSYTRQVGVVDQRGSWSVWELEGRLASSGSRCVAKGLLAENGGENEDHLDGWLRIVWVCSPSVFAICTRGRLTVFRIGEDGEHSAMNVDVFRERSGWILDMVTLPLSSVYLFVLTSSRLSLLRVTEQPENGLEVKEVTSTRHYRNSAHLTTRLTVFDVAGVYMVFMRSSINPIVLKWQLSFDEDDRARISDPAELTFSADFDATAITGWHFTNVQYNSTRRARKDTEALCNRDRGIQFATMTYLPRDLSLSQILYAAMPNLRQDPVVAAPDWTTRAKAGNTRVGKESFVMDDDDVEIENIEQRRARPHSWYQHRRTRERSLGLHSAWTLPFERTAYQLEIQGTSHLIQPSKVIDEAERVLRQRGPNRVLPPSTVRELEQAELEARDLEETATRLQELAVFDPDQPRNADDSEAIPEESTRLAIRPIKTSAHARSGLRENAMDVVALHDFMVRDWITPLSREVPGRVRLAKEQLIKRAAAELSLASLLIRPEKEEQLDTQPELPPEQSWELPVRGALPSSVAMPSPGRPPSFGSHLAPQQSALPTPSPSASATASLITGSSHPSSFAAPEIARLSLYTTFSKPAPPALPRSLGDVLSHWSVAADPAAYDWLSTSRRILQRNEDVDEQMTERERVRMQRRAERHIRRQRREAEASQAAQMASSQAPMVLSASQPQQQARSMAESQPVASSSQAQSQSQSQSLGAFPASQIVPGRFGGRPPPRKRRKQGF